MLTPDVRVEDFTAPDWIRLVELFRPSRDSVGIGAGVRADGEREGGLLVVADGDRLSKITSTSSGRIPPGAVVWPTPLDELAAAHDARWVLVARPGALESVMERFAERLQRSDDLTAQLLILANVLQEVTAEGSIQTWPFSISPLPLPTDRMIERALDVICPDGKTLLLAAFDRGEVSTCVAAHRRGRGFDRIVGPEKLRRDMGLTSRDWTRDYRHLARAVELGVGPLALGCFAEERTWRRLATSKAPGTWAAAVAARDVVLHPVVPAVAIPLGVDLTRAAVATVRGLADRFGSGTWLGDGGRLTPAIAKLMDLARGDADLDSVLGFDPMSIVREALQQSESELSREPTRADGVDVATGDAEVDDHDGDRADRPE